ncbi:MAG: glycoside hydrolase family 15 protein [Catalinimonas sp.]
MTHSERAYRPIGDYGVIGNLHTVALVGQNGSIDFMCFPRFDSPSLFAALLDRKKGGYFQIQPLLDDYDVRQMYLPDTNILMTRFLDEKGVGELIDFMPVKEQESRCVLVRTIRSVRGTVRYRLRCCPRFDYARAEHHAEQENNVTLLRADGTMIRLFSSVPIEVREGEAGLPDAYAEFELSEGEHADFVMEAVSDAEAEEINLKAFVDDAFRETNAYWKAWVGRIHYRGRWQAAVNRSALTLKLLTSYHLGSTVAAATFGLPEEIGGERNWDYRYTWIRDAAFTMYAFIRLGYMEEADRFLDWIKRQFEEVHEGGALQLMYGIDGRTDLKEEELDHLEGYKESRPVRIGNGAHGQLQLDIYGELMDCIYLYDKFGGPITWEFWQKMAVQIDFVCKNWQRADHGIWEVRDEQKHFLHSRLMCWVALDRAIKLVQKRSFPAPLDVWRKNRDLIYDDIYEHFFNEEKGAFVQYRDGDALDASALLMPLMRFVSPVEPRWLRTLDAIGKELITDSLVYRYKTDGGASDGLDGEEGTFSMCSFWYVECLAKAGHGEEARLFFEKMLGYANHLGLYAEQLDLRGRQLGNYPQAFTHLGLISAALALHDQLEGRPVGVS